MSLTFALIRASLFIRIARSQPREVFQQDRAWHCRRLDAEGAGKAKLDQRVKRQARYCYDANFRGSWLCHPGRNGQGDAVWSSHDVARFVVHIVQPDHRKGFTAERTKPVPDYDF